MSDIDLSLFNKSNLKIIKKGSYILKQGDVASCIYYLKKGICYTSSISKDGSENIYWYFQEGDFPCISPALTQDPSPLNIVAKTDCHLYPINHKEFNDFFQNYPDFAWSIANVLLKQMNSMVTQYQARFNFNTPSKVCYALLKLATKKIIKGEKKLIVDKSFSQVEISKYIGVHQVTFSLIFKKLRELRAVEKTSNGIHIVNKKMLEHYAFIEELHYKDCRN